MNRTHSYLVLCILALLALASADLFETALNNTGRGATCIPEGENYIKGLECCQSMVPINCSEIENNSCTDCGELICSSCGNGVCGDNENACNCPADCSIKQFFDENLFNLLSILLSILVILFIILFITVIRQIKKRSRPKFHKTSEGITGIWIKAKQTEHKDGERVNELLDRLKKKANRDK